MRITLLDMFTNLCLVLPLLFADSLVPKFRFQLTNKIKREVREMLGDSIQFGVTALALFLYVLYSDRARCFNN